MNTTNTTTKTLARWLRLSCAAVLIFLPVLVAIAGPGKHVIKHFHPPVSGTITAGRGADAVTSNWMIPFQGTYFVDNGASSEFVDLSGSAHLVVKFSPVDPCRIHTNLVSVSGVGQTSGLSYRLTGAAKFELDAEPGSRFEFVGSYRLTPTDPCKGCPARFLRIRYAVTLDSEGEVTAATASADVTTTVDSK